MTNLANEFESTLGHRLQRYLKLKALWATNYVSGFVERLNKNMQKITDLVSFVVPFLNQCQTMYFFFFNWACDTLVLWSTDFLDLLKLMFYLLRLIDLILSSETNKS